MIELGLLEQTSGLVSDEAGTGEAERAGRRGSRSSC
jgi:hypothetical protein